MTEKKSWRDVLGGVDDHDWVARHIHFTNKALVDGTTFKPPGVLMVRRVDGKDQYRIPTSDEENRYWEAIAW